MLNIDVKVILLDVVEGFVRIGNICYIFIYSDIEHVVLEKMVGLRYSKISVGEKLAFCLKTISLTTNKIVFLLSDSEYV